MPIVMRMKRNNVKVKHYSKGNALRNGTTEFTRL